MRIRHTTSSGSDEIELQMTPMIDIVFQLLIFFVMTFKIVVQEGDFNIKMPKASNAPSEITPDLPPFTIELKANQDGTLRQIKTSIREIDVNAADRGNVLAAFAALRGQVVEFVGQGTGPDSIREKAEAEIKADEHLHYIYVIDSVTHISGYTRGNEVIKLLQNIKFAPPQGKN